MNAVWVIGSGGLLGSALVSDMGARGCVCFQSSEGFRWTEANVLPTQMAKAVDEFAQQVTPDRGWEIYWAAGIGNMGSTAEELQPETVALQALLDALAQHETFARNPGAFALSSSAGAIYADCPDEVITEQSSPAPSTPYGHEKLRQEALVHAFQARAPQHRLLIARISTVFGPRRGDRPAQGLFSFLARSMFRGEPVRVFVPLDTMRDYIYSEDAARAMVSALRAVEPGQGPVTKIIAAQRTTTIAEIVAVFNRVGHRHPRIVTGATALSAKYSSRIKYRSAVGPNTAEQFSSPLHVCVARILEAERLAFVSPARG